MARSIVVNTASTDRSATPDRPAIFGCMTVVDISSVASSGRLIVRPAPDSVMP